MSKKKITVCLDGKDIVLHTDNFYFYDSFFEHTGIDLIAESGNLSEGKGELVNMLQRKEYIKVVTGLIYAGYYAEHCINKTEPELSYDMIKHIMYSMGFVEAQAIMEKYNASKASSEEPEEKKEKSQISQ